MQLTSAAFPQGSVIPDTYTCRGANLSPPLSWSGTPPDAKSLALIVDDPDAPKGVFTHWIAWNIPTERSGLAPGLPAAGQADSLYQGSNDFGRAGYGGPCPPQGHGPHRYVFRIYALDTTLHLPPGAARSDLEKALEGHVVDQAELVGKYEIR
jgi:Raf kinase inhibitor-like YbhB/YbcL family protein